ncbi:hypothetical protein AVEN_87198-1 [Araneus ventricosus]|uniref:C2H2-type domain-containing protein n=1 Tax=Araneus ventricosus TaxID=182803 RepID=A0A4Y2THZ7_ARAVE|nr:hypothetical protein AVEN_87198-1 [Araneus ventricosus]
MDEQLNSAFMTSGSEQPAPDNLNSVAYSPPNLDNSNSYMPLDCSVRLQDILTSPSPICKRTRMQLRMRQTAVIHVSLDPTDQEGPLDLSPKRLVQNDHVTNFVMHTPVSSSSPSGVDLTQSEQNEDELLEHTPSDSVVCIGYMPSHRSTEIQYAPEDVVEIIRNLSITESPVNLFPDTTKGEVSNNSHTGKFERDVVLENGRRSPIDPDVPIGNPHPAIRIENVSSPVQIQQIEYFPFSLRCAFCDLNLSSPSSFAEHVLEVHSGYPASQFGAVQQQVNEKCYPTAEKNDSPPVSPGDSEKDSPSFECEKCREVCSTEAAFLQHICSPSPSRSWACVLCDFVAKKRRGLRFHMKEKHNTWKVRVNEHGLPVANLTPAVPRTPKARIIKFDSPREGDATLSSEGVGNPSTSKPLSDRHPTCAKNAIGSNEQKSGTCQAQKQPSDLPLDLCLRDSQARCSKCAFVAPSVHAPEKHCSDSHSPVLSTPYEVELPESPEDILCSRSKPTSGNNSCLALTPFSQYCPVCGTLCRSSEELLSHDC